MFRKSTTLVIMLLFIGMIITSSNGYTEENEKFGCYQGLIIGRISNLERSENDITFHAVSVTIFPGRYHLAGSDVRLDTPFFGILTSKLIIVLGAIYSGW